MIVCHKYRFIYIQNRKVASSSVQACLAQHCCPDDVVTRNPNSKWPMENPDRNGGWNVTGLWNPLPDVLYGAKWRNLVSDLVRRRKYYSHMPACLIRSRVPRELWDSYFKFCIERNPWDKTLSYYSMKSHQAGSEGTFADFIASGKFCSDFTKYTDKRGNLLVDRVIRYENLAAELAQVMGRLGIPFAGELGFSLNSQFRKGRGDYREHFSPEQRALVEKAYANEIRMFGYQF